MTVHRTLPSEIEPDTLIDLVNDCYELPATATRVAALVPQPRRAMLPPTVPLVITEQMAHLVDGIEDYGS